MSATDIVFSVIILIFSVIIHEISHGYMALYLGDPTAKYQGRLTLNPIKHIDPVGSIVVPLVTGILSGGSLTFGWAKPVPFNPYNLRNKRWGELMVAAAGPAANIAIATVFAIFIRLSGQVAALNNFFAGVGSGAASGSAGIVGSVAGSAASATTTTAGMAAFSLIAFIVLINVTLAIFNLIPIPPLDGSKILFAFFPPNWQTFRRNLERYQLVLLLIYVFLVWQFIAPLIFIVFQWLTGIVV